jgi:hypothetical protein
MSGETNWLGVVSRDHVLRGVEGIAQIGHGKSGGLRRMSAGDGFVYYSPRDWGYALRRGLIELSAKDFALIHAAITAGR